MAEALRRHGMWISRLIDPYAAGKWIIECGVGRLACPRGMANKKTRIGYACAMARNQRLGPVTRREYGKSVGNHADCVCW